MDVDAVAVCSALVVCSGALSLDAVKPENTVDAVCALVVCGGGDIVFNTKSSNQWLHYGVDAVE